MLTTVSAPVFTNVQLSMTLPARSLMLPLPEKPFSKRLTLPAFEANVDAYALKVSEPARYPVPRVLGILHRIGEFVREIEVPPSISEADAGILIISNGVTVPAFCINIKNVLADAGTTVNSAKIPKIVNLFAILNTRKTTLAHGAFFLQKDNGPNALGSYTQAVKK